MNRTDLRIAAEVRSGIEVSEVAARYNVTEAYVHRATEDADEAEAKRFDWSLDPWGNRLFYSCMAGVVINLLTGSHALATVAAVVLFVLTSAIILSRR